MRKPEDNSELKEAEEWLANSYNIWIQGVGKFGPISQIEKIISRLVELCRWQQGLLKDALEEHTNVIKIREGAELELLRDIGPPLDEAVRELSNGKETGSTISLQIKAEQVARLSREVFETIRKLEHRIEDMLEDRLEGE